MPYDSSRSKSANLQRILADRLPDEVILPTSWRRAVMAVFLTVLLVVAVNLFARWYLDSYPSNRGYWLAREKWKLLESLSEPVDWLILGDSSANQGVIPGIIEAQLGGTAVNLATTAGMVLLDDVWMLEEYIERHGPPENVLVVHTVDVWDRNIQKVMIAKVPRPWGFWRTSAVGPDLDYDQWLDVFLARYVPLFGENKSIMTTIGIAAKSPEKLFTRRYNLEPGGYMAREHTNRRLTEKETDRWIDRFGRVSFTTSAINQASLERMIALADEHDFDLYLAAGPLHDRLLHDEKAQAYLNALHQSLGTIVADSDNVHYISRTAGFPIEQMENVDHVIHPAAEIYSQMLASDIESIRASSASQP
jgi:hypothetical protein